jgi:CheY-like chemotaxis protein
MADPTPARLLVVDDDPMLRTTVGRALRLEGYDVVARRTASSPGSICATTSSAPSSSTSACRAWTG